MWKKTLPIALFGLMMGCFRPVMADSSIESLHEPPNLYEFAGRNLSIFYSTSSLDGQPRLSFLRRSGRLREFVGDEIRVEDTGIGQLVSVTIRQVPDLKFVTLTLLIPGINLDAGETAMFETRVFLTSHHTTIAGQDFVEGPQQTYFSPEVIGRASSVDFLVPDSTGVFGEVIQSPTCPGPQKPGQKCTGPLADALVQLRDAADQVVATAITDARGLFALHAEPGEYTIDVDTGGALPHCESVAVTVPDSIVTARLKCDTGIR